MGELERFSVTVCLVTYNRRGLLLNALESLGSQTRPVSEVVLVDNSSSDGTVEAVTRDYPDVKVIRLHENKGCPPARNIAMANARSEFIANLDDDGAFAPDALENAMEIFRKYPDTGIVMMDIIEDGHSRVTKYLDEQIIPVFSAGCSIIRASVLETCGYFDDDIFRQGEEYDLSIRVLEKGWQIRFSRDAKMYHDPPEIFRENPDYINMGAINKSLTLVKYAPAKYLFLDLARRLFGHSILFLKNGRLDLVFKLLGKFFIRLPSAIRTRKVLGIGYPISRKLHRTYGR